MGILYSTILHKINKFIYIFKSRLKLLNLEAFYVRGDMSIRFIVGWYLDDEIISGEEKGT